MTLEWRISDKEHQRAGNKEGIKRKKAWACPKDAEELDCNISNMFSLRDVMQRQWEGQEIPTEIAFIELCSKAGEQDPQGNSEHTGSESSGRSSIQQVNKHSWRTFPIPELQGQGHVSERQQLFFVWPEFNSITKLEQGSKMNNETQASAYCQLSEKSAWGNPGTKRLKWNRKVNIITLKFHDLG